MKLTVKCIAFVFISLMLSGCIEVSRPENDIVEVKSGETVVFRAYSGDWRSDLVWYLDGETVAFDTHKYLFTAGPVAHDEVLEYQLKVREEGGRFQWYITEKFGIDYSDSKTWTIRVMPPENGGSLRCYLDEDGDGYGDVNKMWLTDAPPGNCVENNADCDDDDAAIHPNAAETCNGMDDNCDGVADEDVQITFFQDTDGDGYGTPEETIQACNAPAGYVADNTDCNDYNAEVHPGSTEIQCDGIDNDCSDGDFCLTPTPTPTPTPEETYYRDVDGDGYGDPDVSTIGAQDGYVSDNTDCDDSNAAVNPAAAEVCNGIDDNCNGRVDNQESGVVCSSIPAAPTLVSASDMADTSVMVTWSASTGADYYKVYRAAWSASGSYENVSGEITDTSFSYAESWMDAYEQIGGLPACFYNETDEAAIRFIKQLDTYMEKALPVLMSFKAPAYFKVAACNSLGCSDMSPADAGQAQYVHNSSSSEVAQVVAPLLVYPMMRTMDTVPRSEDAMNWCGMDLCGNVGGMFMGRVLVDWNTFNTQTDYYYENYTLGSNASTDATVVLDGHIGGLQDFNAALQGIVKLSGDVDILMPNGEPVSVSAYFEFNENIPAYHGYAKVSYKNRSHTFTLPVQPENGRQVGPAPPMIPAGETWTPVDQMDTAYPTPLCELNAAKAANCVGNESPVIKQCTRIQ